MNFAGNKLLKLGTSVLLLLCLLPMPYGYYEFVGFATAVVFAWLAYEERKSKKKYLMVAYIAVAVLFQPFLKLELGRVMWNVVDVAVAAYLAYSLIHEARITKDDE